MRIDNLQRRAQAVNRTLENGNHTLRPIDDLGSIADSVTMKNAQSKNRTDATINSESLLQLLSERLLLWDQQEAAEAAGEWHQALALEQSIRSISPRIRQSMGLLVPTQTGGSER